jgi:hypothetical protein
VRRDALCDRDAGLFAADNVRLVTERTMAEVLREAEDLLRSATRQDTVLLYYRGHGVLDQSGELFLCTHDSRTEWLRSTAVKASDLQAMMDESAAEVRHRGARLLPQRPLQGRRAADGAGRSRPLRGDQQPLGRAGPRRPAAQPRQPVHAPPGRGDPPRAPDGDGRRGPFAVVRAGLVAARRVRRRLLLVGLSTAAVTALLAGTTLLLPGG